MEITVKIELGTKERKLIEELIARLGELGHGCTCSCENLQPEAEPQPEPMKDPTSEPMPDPDEAFAAQDMPELPADFLREKIRGTMQQFVITDKREAIKDLLMKYGVAKASALPDDRLAEFEADLRKVCEA